MPEADNPQAFRHDIRLARIEAWLEEHYAGEISLAAAASVVGLEAKYFSRFFRDKTGVRFSERVRAVRIRAAARMIRSADHSITSVAFDVGFNDLRTFERAFRKQLGMAPREYRDRVRPAGWKRSGLR